MFFFFESTFIFNLKILFSEVVLAKFTSFDSAGFSKICNNWFRLGNQRAKQQPAQVQKQNQQVNNDQSSKNNN